ncbi:hypothetical protein BHM03_00043730 [Ensete ventricosum]|nr:hypothetical protein BHM03_00043730 [Ensete ventricosum]
MVRTGPPGYRYVDHPLPSKIDRWRSISAVGGRLREKSTVSGRLREKSTVGGRLREKSTAYPELLQAFQGAARSGSESTMINKAVAGEALPRGRRVDERAARAAAEVRKKAVARGILVRQNVNPVQRLPPLSELLNIINSGSTPEAPTSDQAHEPKTESSSGPVSDVSTGASDANGSIHGDQAPVGLGASLDFKKQKSKLKATL